MNPPLLRHHHHLILEVTEMKAVLVEVVIHLEMKAATIHLLHRVNIHQIMVAVVLLLILPETKAAVIVAATTAIHHLLLKKKQMKLQQIHHRQQPVSQRVQQRLQRSPQLLKSPLLLRILTQQSRSLTHKQLVWPSARLSPSSSEL